MINLYIVRHGETDYNVAHRIQGSQPNTSLNENGRRQARAIKDKIKSFKIDTCFCSPLTRTKETASIIFDGEIITDKRLIERGFGEFEGKSTKEIGTDWAKIGADIPDGVESIESMLKRAGELLEEIKLNRKNKNILLVTHSAISRALRACINGIPQSGDLYEFPRLENCGILSYKLR